MATCYRTKGKGDNLQGTKQNVPDKLHFEQKYHVYSRIRNRIMPVGWHMKKTREMANYFTSSDPNHGISRDIFWHTVWFMFQFPLLQMHRLIKLKTLTSMKLQASGRSHFGLVHDGQNYEAICMQASPNSSGVTGDCRPILTLCSWCSLLRTCVSTRDSQRALIKSCWRHTTFSSTGENRRKFLCGALWLRVGPRSAIRAADGLKNGMDMFNWNPNWTTVNCHALADGAGLVCMHAEASLMIRSWDWHEAVGFEVVCSQ